MEKRKEMWRALPFVMALLLLTLVPAQSASALFGKSKRRGWGNRIRFTLGIGR